MVVVMAAAYPCEVVRPSHILHRPLVEGLLHDLHASLVGHPELQVVAAVPVLPPPGKPRQFEPLRVDQVLTVEPDGRLRGRGSPGSTVGRVVGWDENECV